MGERVLACELTVRVFDRGPEPAWHEDGRRYTSWRRYEAELEGYAAVREGGRSPWDAVHRLVSNASRAVGAQVVDVGVTDGRLAPDAVISLGEWAMTETGESVELVCVVMRSVQRSPSEEQPLEMVRQDLPVELHELAWFVLEV